MGPHELRYRLNACEEAIKTLKEEMEDLKRKLRVGSKKSTKKTSE